LAGPIVRVATFNIHGGKGEGNVRDLDRTATYLRDFDIVGLNEVGNSWLGRSVSQAEALGQRLGMAALFVPAERRYWHDHFGNGLLTRVELGTVQRIPLVSTIGRGFRNAVLTRFRLAHMTVNLLVAHLNVSSGREGQLQAVSELFLSLQEPAILMGDLNTEMPNQLLARLLERASDAVAEGEPGVRTMPRRDWILTRGFKTVRGGLVANDASDHPLCWAELAVVQ